MTDSVNSPSHYNAGKIEVIDFLEDQKLGFHLGNVVKYICRSAHKGSELEDLAKAAWYLNRFIESRKSGSQASGSIPVPTADTTSGITASESVEQSDATVASQKVVCPRCRSDNPSVRQLVNGCGCGFEDYDRFHDAASVPHVDSK